MRWLGWLACVSETVGCNERNELHRSGVYANDAIRKKLLIASYARSTAVLFLIILTTGCATTPAALYPEFENQKQRPITLFMDIAVAHDVSGNVDLIDVMECEQLSRTVIEILRNGLEAKGYRIDNAGITSMGLIWESGNKYKVIHSEEERALPVEQIENQPPPFFVAPDFRNDPDRFRSLSAIYRSLAKINKKKGQPNATVTPASLETFDEGTVMVVLTGARDVPLWKQLGQAFITGIATTGIVAIWQTSVTWMDTYVVDTTTGEVIWSDRQFINGGRANERSLVYLARASVKHFP